MSLRIGCDLDGVLADMQSELVRHARLLFGELPQRPRRGGGPENPADSASDRPPPAGPAPRAAQLDMINLTERQERRLWRHVEAIDGFWETLKEIEPGVVLQLASLAHARRWELIFLTKRPESAGATVQVQTQRWLHALGFPLPSVFVVQGSRGRVADALNLDFVIDDRPENCLDVVIDSKARAILVWRDEEKYLAATVKRPGVTLVASTVASFAILTQADESASRRPGLVERLKRRIGFSKATDR